MFLLRASLLDEEVALLISMEVVKQMVSVIDVAEKTIEFRNFQNFQFSLDVAAGHWTMDLQPKDAAALQKQLTGQMWEQERQGQEATILRPSSEKNIGLDSSSITLLVAMTATSRKDPFPVTAFLSHARERCSATIGVIDTGCARTLDGTR